MLPVVEEMLHVEPGSIVGYVKPTAGPRSLQLCQGAYSCAKESTPVPRGLQWGQGAYSGAKEPTAVPRNLQRCQGAYSFPCRCIHQPTVLHHSGGQFHLGSVSANAVWIYKCHSLPASELEGRESRGSRRLRQPHVQAKYFGHCFSEYLKILSVFIALSRLSWKISEVLSIHPLHFHLYILHFFFLGRLFIMLYSMVIPVINSWYANHIYIYSVSYHVSESVLMFS